MLHVLLGLLYILCIRTTGVLWQGGGDGRGGARAEGREVAATEALAYGRAVLVLARGRGAGGVEAVVRHRGKGAQEQARGLGDLDEEAVRGEGLVVVVEMHEQRDVRDAGAERVQFEAAAGGARTVCVGVARDGGAREPGQGAGRRVHEGQQARGKVQHRLLEGAPRWRRRCGMHRAKVVSVVPVFAFGFLWLVFVVLRVWQAYHYLV